MLVLASKVPFLIETAFGPGFTLPVTIFPSHLRFTVTGLRSRRLGPQSPDQVPLIGSDAGFCANAGNSSTKEAAKQKRAKNVRYIQPPLTLHGLRSKNSKYSST